MSYLINNIPTNEDEWDKLWKQIQAENELKTERECYQFLTQMVLEKYVGLLAVLASVVALGLFILILMPM